MPLAASARTCLGAGAVVCAHVAAPAAGAQTIAPPLAEYRERAFASFGLRNDALVPVTVVLEPFAFTVDSLGNLAYQPFDSSRVRLRVSATSLRLPPRGGTNVSYEVSTDSVPAWLVITATFIPPRTRGVNLRAQLPHVIYLYQSEPLRREDVEVSRVDYDSAGRRVRVRVENHGSRLGRMRDGHVRPARGDEQPLEAFPLFPHAVRWLDVPWTAATRPAAVHLEFDGFTLDADVPAVDAAHAAP